MSAIPCEIGTGPHLPQPSRPQSPHNILLHSHFLHLCLGSVHAFRRAMCFLFSLQSLSLSRIKGFSGCSVGLYPPRGSNPPPQDRRRVLYPLCYEEMSSALLF